MLQSQVFAARPQSAAILRYIVEESIRNGHAAIGQRLIAVHGLGLESDFSPTRSSEIRVKVARLRRALARYYTGLGRNDPLVFVISPGPYRLIVSGNAVPGNRPTAPATPESRGTLPTLLLMEPAVQAGLDGFPWLAADVSLRLGGLLAESAVVNVSGPLPHARVATAAESPTSRAAALGYDFVAQTEISTSASQWTVRMTVTDTRLGRLAAVFHERFRSEGATPPTEAITMWMNGRISDSFAARE